MSDDRLFDVVFEGRPLNDVPLEKAIASLAGLLQREPDQVAALFNERSRILKRGVPRKTALRYHQVLKNAGLACHVASAGSSLDTGKTQKKSVLEMDSRSSQPPGADAAPITEPSGHQASVPPHEVADKKSYRFSFPDPGWIINLASLSFLLPQSLDLESAPADLPPATLGQRIWAAVSTFFHMIFMGYVMAFPVGIMGGLYLRFSGAAVTRNTVDALRGGSILLGMVTAVLLLPLLWRGHSFGQRALGILVVPDTGEDIDDLGGPAMMVRRLTFRTRCACAEPISSRPWNSALIPFAATIVLHVILIPLSVAFIWIADSYDKGSSPGRIHTLSHKEAIERVTTRARHNLRLIDSAMRVYIAEYGMAPKPLTRSLFKEILNKYMPSSAAKDLLEKLDNGHLKLQGDLAEYRIGIYENDRWIVLNEQGKISEEEF
jgi:hypothetical protein